MKISPLNKYIQIEIERTTVGGIETDIAEDVGTVIASREDKLIGKKVIFKVWALQTVKVNGELLHFLDFDSGGVLAVIDED